MKFTPFQLVGWCSSSVSGCKPSGAAKRARALGGANDWFRSMAAIAELGGGLRHLPRNSMVMGTTILV
jgi:hypothetical protein